jgi:hypothetical protein
VQVRLSKLKLPTVPLFEELGPIGSLHFQYGPAFSYVFLGMNEPFFFEPLN